MVEIINILILLFIGLISEIYTNIQSFFIIPFLVIIILCCTSLSIKKYSKLSYLYLGLSLLFQDFIVFLPCAFYIIISDEKLYISYILFFAPFLLHIQYNSNFIVFITMIIAYTLKIIYIKDEKLRNAYRTQRDNTKELADLLQKTNKDLLVHQQQEIHIGILNERNRIAREIHDHVGHLLSSALLQIGAIETINTQDNLNDSIHNLKKTISNGMDNVRKSVHNLHEDSLNLETIVSKLCEEFSFCEAKFEYDVINDLSNEKYYHFLAIIKEAMNNTIKHSNATSFSIVLREQPLFYQLIIQDNGNQISKNNSGMGLQNMKDRVEAMRGILNINTSKGFQIFITIPKEGKNNESINYR